MAVALGFVIALAISLTGVGAGSMTTPLLILVLRVPPAIAVGTALTFGAIVKLISVPNYIFRRQINLKVLGLMLAGGVPGVLGGSVFLASLKGGDYESWLYVTLGILIAATASFTLFRTLKPRRNRTPKDRSFLLPWLALPIGAEVGFSSAGSGALGSLILLGLTKLTAAEVVGTDLSFGLILALVGSAFHLGTGNYDGALLFKLSIGGVVGALTGSAIVGKIAPLPMRLALLVVLVILGTQLALHGQSMGPHLQAVLR